MPQRDVVFSTGEIYHIYNRSVGQETIFSSHYNLHRITKLINYYRFPQIIRYSQYRLLTREAKQVYEFTMYNRPEIVEIYAFSFMPNHYHFLLRQTGKFGIRNFISNIQNGFAKFFNIKYKRHGTLFQHPFQGRWIESNEQCIHVSRYIHLNHVTAFIVPFEKLSTYPFSSFPSYVGSTSLPWINSEFLINQFASREQYVSFVADQADYQRTLAYLKNVQIE